MIKISNIFNKKPSVEKQKLESSLNKFHGEAATSAVETAGDAYQSPSLIASGIEAQGVAIVSALINLILSLFCIKSPAIIEKIGHVKKAMIILGFLNTISWLPIILALVFLKSVSPLWFVALWIVCLIPTTLLLPLRDSWLATLIPRTGVGRYLGSRLVVYSTAYLGSLYVMGYLLDRFQFGNVFTAIFGIALLASLGSFLLYRVIDAPTAKPNPKKVDFNFLDFIGETRKGGLGAFILYVSLFTFAVHLVGPLYAVHLLKDLQFSYLTYTAVISTEYVARVISTTFWGRYGAPNTWRIPASSRNMCTGCARSCNPPAPSW